MKTNRLLARLAFALALAGAPAAHAQQTGIVTGRVLNVTNDMYLETARVTVEGTTLEAYTDATGAYILSNVPAGSVTVRAFYTGLAPQKEIVNVAPGATVRQNFNLAGLHSPRQGAGDSTVVLDPFVVASAKEMDGAAIAINEQRFAPNFKNVVSTDEFGHIPDGNVAEFMKFLPGVSVVPTFGDNRTIELDGAPPRNVPVSFGGFEAANTTGASQNRSFEFEHVSLNNIARVEVAFTPTPETTGSALAGSVNMVPRSAFERSKPVFTWSVYAMMRDTDLDFGKVPGPRDEWNKINPGFDFSYIRPVNDRFGFTISGGHSKQYSRWDFMSTDWVGGGRASDGNALPHTTPDNAYMRSYSWRLGSKLTARTSLGLSVDYKPAPFDRITFNLQWGGFSQEFNQLQADYNVGRVAAGNWGTTFTRGSPGAGSIGMSTRPRDKDGGTWSPNLMWRHDGPVWKSEVGASYSRATNRHTDVTKGFFSVAEAGRSNLTVSFDEITPLRPGVITVTDAAGVPVDPFAIDSYFLTNANGTGSQGYVVRRSALANLRRDFHGRIPLSLKTGIDLRQELRDARNARGPTSSYVGPDGAGATNASVAASADNNARIAYGPEYDQLDTPFGFPHSQWLSSRALYDVYKRNPDHFRLNEVAMYNNRVNASTHAEEVISAAYLRGDLQFFKGRLKLVGGLRGEQTNVKGEAALVDASLNFQRDAAGNVVRRPNGTPEPITTDPLEAAMLTRIDRGSRTNKEYLRWFPSLNASYDLTESLKVRAGYYQSVGRPPFSQYAGALTLPNLDDPPTPNNRIDVNNAGIKAWDAKIVKVGVEYYFQQTGTISISAWRRDLTNVFGTSLTEVTPEFLGLYGLDPNLYGEYQVSTQYNITTPVRWSGVTFNYRQQLTFLPHWARGVGVFATGNTMRVTGADVRLAPTFFNPRTATWGISLSRPKFSVRANWSWRAERPNIRVAESVSIRPDTRNVGEDRLELDLSGEYRLTKRYALFATLQNVTDEPHDNLIYGPTTAPYARLKQREVFGSLWTIGVKGSF